MKVIIGSIFVAALLLALSHDTYMEGFDAGAAAAQCLDFHAAYGPEEAMKTGACKDAAEYQKSASFKLLGHRMSGQ